MLLRLVIWARNIRKTLTLFALTSFVSAACPAADLESEAEEVRGAGIELKFS